MKVAIIHYWLVNMRGGEKVIETILDIFPEADIYTHVIDPDKISDKIKSRLAGTTFIQKLPRAEKWYQNYLPLMPYALEQLDLRQYDLIISSESGPAKGVITSPNAMHICYCHSPMRYAWDMYHDYTEHLSPLKKFLSAIVMHKLRLWDLASAYRVDHFIANSSFVQKRIGKFYRRDCEVIFPPVDIDDFYLSDEKGDFYLMVGQLVGYKNTRLAVEAFNINQKRLVIIGVGEELESLKKLANDNVTFMGYQSFDVIREHYARCKALIFPGVEDFGMVPVEAMASGRPVIALKKGGALDTVVDNKTGIFFNEATAVSLNQAIEQFEAAADVFDSGVIRQHAKQFDVNIFKLRLSNFIEQNL